MKRKVERNVNGSAPVGTPTFNEKFPKGSPEREAMLLKMEQVTGIEFLPVCIKFDNEMAAMKKAEADAAAERKRAAIAGAAKPKV